MRIDMGTIELHEDDRAAIAAYYGQSGKAPRDVCRRFVLDNGLGAIDDARRTYLSDETEA
jgi:hypothetical protein